MAISTLFTEAARRYGLDDFADASAAAHDALLGAEVATATSWGPEGLAFGQGGTLRTDYANGFTVTLSLVVLGADAAEFTVLRYLRTDTTEVLVQVEGSSIVALSNLSSAAIGAGDDNIIGNSAGNVMQGFGGNDRIDGGAGTDTAVLAGAMSQYFVSRDGAAITVTGPDGYDTLRNVERLRFDDLTIAYDTSGTTGQAFRLYQAALGRAPDQPGLGYQTGALDAGLALRALAQNFIDSPEFSTRYGALSDAGFVTQLYANVLHRAPDAGGAAYYAQNMAAGLSRADVLVGFSESPENQAALIGVIAGGMVYSG